MQKSQSGFTLVELVVVIVLLGILGVTALGKFQDLSGEAENAAIAGVASELSSSSAVNYASSILNVATATDIDHAAGAGSASTTALACSTALDGLFASGERPLDYTYTFQSTTATTNPACDNPGDVYVCQLSKAGTADTPDASITCTGG